MILIDDRAGSKDLIQHPPLSSLGQLCRLQSADVCFHGNGPTKPVLVGIEVKSIGDLISSANTGRLQASQIPAMLDNYTVSWLLVYGIYRPNPDDEKEMLQVRRGKFWTDYRLGSRPVPWGYVESFLLTLTALGIHVKPVNDVKAAVSWIGVLYRWWQKEWKQHKGLKTFDTSGEISLLPGIDPQTRQRMEFAKCLPGIGWERALAVAQHFGSIEEMVLAEEKEWLEIDGIGKTIARSVREAVKRRREK